MHCNLWDVHTAIESTLGGSRQATASEAAAYMDWQRQRRGLPDLGTMKLHWKDFGKGRAAFRICVGATFGAGEDGAYSIVMPGHDAHRHKVTLETLNDAGEIVASSTMPLEPKKGGLIWSMADVRVAHGKIRKGQPMIIPDHCEALPEISASAATEAQEGVAPAIACHEAQKALSGPEIAPLAGEDPLADVLARLDALESQLATLSGERADAPNGGMQEAVASPAAAGADEQGSQVQTMPRHAHDRARRERMVRRYLAMRAERAKAKQEIERWKAHCDTWADEVTMLEQANERLKAKRRASVTRAMTLQRKRDAARLKAASALAHSEKTDARVWEEWDHRRKNAERGRRMVAAARADAHTARQSASASRAALAALRASLADPARPERASDIARLVQERDTARNALAALQHRATSMQSALDSSANIIEDFGLRLAKAEAAVRRMVA